MPQFIWCAFIWLQFVGFFWEGGLFCFLGFGGIVVILGIFLFWKEKLSESGGEEDLEGLGRKGRI